MGLRPYQLQHPELVTDAMNRLARAFTCLTNPEAKRVYDAALHLTAPAGLANSEPSGETLDPLCWLFGPWSQIGATMPAGGLGEQHVVADWAQAPPPARRKADAFNKPQRFPAVRGAMVSAQPASVSPGATATAAPEPTELRPRLWTRRSLYQSIVVVRRLLHCWQRVGIVLGDPAWRMTKSREAIELIRQLGRMRELLEEGPSVLGEPGQAGYWVASLARQEVVAPLFRALDHDQREALARDWRDGLELLTTRRDCLRRGLQLYRKEASWRHVLRILGSLPREHPSVRVLFWALLLVALVWATVWVLSVY
jgi:hypothetical protein